MNMNHSLHWLLQTLGRKKWYTIILILTEALHGATGVFYALLLRQVVDAATGHDKELFWHGIFLLVLLLALQIMLRSIVRWLSELSRAELENTFKLRLTQTLLDREYLKVSAIHSGEWLNRLTNDTVVVANGITEILPGMAEMVVKFVSGVIMIIVLQPLFAAILAPFGILLIAFTWFFRRRIKRLHKNVQEADGRLRIFLQERLGSLLLLRSFAAERETATDASKKMDAHKKARMRKIRFSNICNIGYGLAMNGFYLLGVGWCGYGILTGRISFGTMTAVTQLITQIQSPITNITGYLPRYYAVLASAERLMEAEEFERQTEEAKSLSQINMMYEEEITAIGLENASFTYYPAVENLDSLSKENMPEVLNNISLEITKGSYTAFTGQSGCGKSTVLKLLMCVYAPDSGLRYYQTGDGKKAQMGSDMRRLFAYVPQGNQLMSGTIRQVVSFADPKHAQDEDKLKRALEIACAREFVDTLDQGADTLLGERGTGLSEGQMQRIAIARAVFSDSPILLLDEATSALDADTEERVLKNLKDLTDKTVIIVTHRPAALEICDRVLQFTLDRIKES